MTDSEYRIGKVEETVHNIDKRQETFETFMKDQIQRQNEIIAEIRQSNKELKEAREIDNARFDEKFDKLSNQMHNLTVGVGVGFASVTLSVIGLIIAIFLKN